MPNTAILALHQALAQAMVLYFTIVGVWALVLAARKSAMSGPLRGALAIGVALGVAQALVGLTLVVTGLRPGDNLHFLYGASVILTVPLVASYIVDKKISRVLAYGLACLFMAGLALRAITTGSPGS